MPDSSSSNWTTALTAGGSAAVAGALAKITLAVIQHNWPWLVDDTTGQAIDDIFTAGMALLATKIAHNVAHKSDSP